MARAGGHDALLRHTYIVVTYIYAGGHDALLRQGPRRGGSSHCEEGEAEATAQRAPRRKNAARREATAQEKRDYAKQFAEAKQAEYKS